MANPSRGRAERHRPEGGETQMIHKTKRPDDDCEVIYRPWITLKNGKRIYAAVYGLKAFRLVISKLKAT
jgi:hypothetical protein